MTRVSVVSSTKRNHEISGVGLAFYFSVGFTITCILKYGYIGRFSMAEFFRSQDTRHVNEGYAKYERRETVIAKTKL